MLNVPKALLEKRITKETLHRSGKRLLKEIALKLELDTNAFSLRNNRGGDGVMGEVVLHGSHLYLQVHFGMGSVLRILYRTCEGQKDYTGGMNHYVSVSELASTTASERFIEKLKQMSALSARENAFHAA